MDILSRSRSLYAMAGIDIQDEKILKFFLSRGTPKQ
jgi:hypothetical protein